MITLHEKNTKCIQGCKLRRTQALKYQLLTCKYTPCNLHTLCVAVSEESGNSLFPGEGPAVTSLLNFIFEFPPLADRKVFHMTLITRFEGRDGGGGRMRGGAGGESPRHVRPQPRFPMPTSDHQSRQGTKYREVSLQLG